MKAIARELAVSSSTVHKWTRDIKLTPEQRNRSAAAQAALARGRNAVWAEACRERRRQYQDQGRREARRGNALHQAGCMLYWAEGTKDRNVLRLTNSDVNLVRFFRHFLTACFSAKPIDFAVSLHLYTGNGLCVAEVERYWLDALGLPRTCLRKHSINARPVSSTGAKKNKLPYGVCNLRALRSTHLVQHIYGAVQEYASFEEPRWLG